MFPAEFVSDTAGDLSTKWNILHVVGISPEEEDVPMSVEDRVKRRVVNLLFILLAFVIWYGSYYWQFDRSAGETGANPATNAEEEQKHFPGEILKDLGVVVAGLALVDILWTFIGGDPLHTDIARVEDAVTSLGKSVRIVDQAQKHGVLQITRKPDAVDMTKPVEAIDSANHSIDMCGYTLHSLFATGQLKDKLEKAIVERKVTVRVCISSPGNKDTPKNCTPGVRTSMPAESQDVLDHLSELKTRLLERKDGAELAKRLTILELKESVMSMSILRRDDLMLVVPYLQHAFTLDSPALLVVRSGADPLFHVYEREFAYICKKSAEYHSKSAPPTAVTT